MGDKGVIIIDNSRREKREIFSENKNKPSSVLVLCIVTLKTPNANNGWKWDKMYHASANYKNQILSMVPQSILN